MHEKTLASETVFEGRILNLEIQQVELENGRHSVREIVRHKPAAAVLARLPSGDFLLVKQFRKAVDRVVLEVVAGICDEGEDSIECGRREVKEETGYDVARIHQMGSILPTPGYVDEKIDIFYAELSEKPGEKSFDHDECVETVVLTKEEIDHLVMNGQLMDAKTLAAWLLYEKGAGNV